MSCCVPDSKKCLCYGFDPEAKKREEVKKLVVRRAAYWHDYKWPEQLSSGIMFFDGERITIEEFQEQVALFKPKD